jgi:adenosylhomocysteine nucleosidase
MRVLVTFAVDAEFALWRKRHDFRREMLNGAVVLYSAKIGEVSVEVFLTGMGAPALRPGFQLLLSRNPHILISSGLAGGLDPSLQVGDIVAARSLALVHGGDRVKSRRKLVEIAEQCGARSVNVFMTSPRIVSQAQYKKAMAAFGDVVDMESYHLLAAASGTQVASIAIRSISDTQKEDLPLDFEKAITPWGTVDPRQLVLQIVRSPHRIPSLIKFGRGTQKATQRLADFLDKYLETIAANSPPWAHDEVVAS